MLAVTDGDENATVYGYARNEDEAREIAENFFADRILCVERYGPIHTDAGNTLREAFVVFTC